MASELYPAEWDGKILEIVLLSDENFGALSGALHTAGGIIELHLPEGPVLPISQDMWSRVERARELEQELKGWGFDGDLALLLPYPDLPDGTDVIARVGDMLSGYR